jgi:hypothetical protein
MKFAHACLVTILLSPFAQANDDDRWLLENIALPMRSSVQFTGGVDADGGKYYGMSTSLAARDAQIYLSANQQQFNVNTQDWSVGLGSNPQQDFSAYIEYAQAGNSDVLETRDVNVETLGYVDAWQFMLGYQTGEVEFILPPTQVTQQRSVLVERSAWHYGVGYTGELLYATLEQRSFDYEKNRAAITGNAIITQIIRTYFRQQVASSASAYADVQTDVTLGAQGDVYGLEIILSRIISIVESAQTDYAHVLLSRNMSESIRLGVEWNKPLDEGVTSVGLNLDWRW